MCPHHTHTHAHTEPVEWDLNFVPLYVAKEGDQLPVSCRATGVPSPTVTYRNQGSNHEKNELFFAAVHLGDNGCRACHEVFDNSRGVFKTNCLTRNFQASSLQNVRTNTTTPFYLQRKTGEWKPLQQILNEKHWLSH